MSHHERGVGPPHLHQIFVCNRLMQAQFFYTPLVHLPRCQMGIIMHADPSQVMVQAVADNLLLRMQRKDQVRQGNVFFRRFLVQVLFLLILLFQKVFRVPMPTG